MEIKSKHKNKVVLIQFVQNQLFGWWKKGKLCVLEDVVEKEMWMLFITQ